MIDLDSIRTTICQAIRIAIGSDLAQQEDPNDPPNTFGLIISARPSKNAPIPEYPYCKVDLIFTDQEGDDLTTSYYDNAETGLVFETSIYLRYQITILGEDTLQLSHKLKTAFRRDQIVEHFTRANLAILDTDVVNSTPEFYDTDFIEQGVFILEIRATDRTVVVDDEFGSYIGIVNGSGDLEHYEDDPDPLGVTINVDTLNP